MATAACSGDRAAVVLAGRSPQGPIVSDPGGGMALRHLPGDFDLVDDTARAGPTRQRTLTYAPDAARSSAIIVTRSASAFDLAGELRELPDAERIDINGRPGVLVRPSRGAIVSWAPAGRLAVTVSVSSRDLAADEVVGVARGIAYDPAADEIPAPPPPGRRSDGSDPTGAKVVVARGGVAAESWELVVYPSEAGLCIDVLAPGGGSSGGCSRDLGGRALLGGLGGTRTADGSPAQYVSGPVRKDVALVRVESDIGAPVLLSPVGADAGFAVNFYASPIPECPPITAIVALDAAGRELDRLTFGPRPSRPGKVPSPTCSSPGGG